MVKGRITLNQAVNFHGHLGPYLILGVLAGELAIKKLRCKRYFGVMVKVWGADKKPKSCLIDGLQLSTGATYGKGNIVKLNGAKIKIEFNNLKNYKRITLGLKDNLVHKLKETKSHKNSEALAEKLYKTDNNKLFKLIT
jgi:formylmethanofuran dehydrogenase subunit E